MEEIKQLIWDFCEKVGIDLEEDNQSAELCDELINNIENKVQKSYIKKIIHKKQKSNFK